MRQLPGAYILIADCVPDHAARVVEHFQRAGHRVEVETDGRAAERRIREEAPDVLVTAGMLFGSDGFALYDLLQAAHPGNRTRTVLLAGWTRRGSR